MFKLKFELLKPLTLNNLKVKKAEVQYGTFIFFYNVFDLGQNNKQKRTKGHYCHELLLFKDTFLLLIFQQKIK